MSPVSISKQHQGAAGQSARWAGTHDVHASYRAYPPLPGEPHPSAPPAPGARAPPALRRCARSTPRCWRQRAPTRRRRPAAAAAPVRVPRPAAPPRAARLRGAAPRRQPPPRCILHSRAGERRVSGVERACCKACRLWLEPRSHIGSNCAAALRLRTHLTQSQLTLPDAKHVEQALEHLCAQPARRLQQAWRRRRPRWRPPRRRRLEPKVASSPAHQTLRRLCRLCRGRVVGWQDASLAAARLEWLKLEQGQ